MRILSVSSRRLRVLLGVASVCLAAATASGEGPAEPVRLEAGVPREGTISGGQSHSYRLHLESGQFADLVVDQMGIDVGLTWTAPDGTKLGELDSANGEFGPEPLCWLASAAGDFRLDIAAGAPKAPEGRYRITVRAVATPGPSDRLRAEAQSLVLQAETLRAQGSGESVAKSVPLYERAAGLYRQAEDVPGEARATLFLALAKDSLGLTPESAAWLQKVLELAPRLQDPGFQAAALTWLGEATNHLGDPTAALALFDRAIEIEERLGDRGLLGFTHGSRAHVCMFIGDHEAAARSLAHARELMAVYGDRRAEAIISNDMALNASDVGEFDEALRGYERAIAIAQEIGDRGNEAISRNNMGLVYGSLGQWDKALEQHERALPLRRALGSRYGEAYTLNNLGVAHGKLGAVDKAEPELSAALELRRQVGDRYGEAITLQALGTLRLESGRPTDALPDLERALGIRRAIADLAGQAETLASIARSARSLGRFEAGLRRAEEAVAVIESLRHRVASSLRASYLGSARSYYELAIDLLMSRGTPGDSTGAIRAFETSERAKARSLIELLAESRADIRQGVDVSLVARELSVRRSLASKLEKQTRLLAGWHTDAQAAEAAAGVETLVGELRDVEDAIRKASPRYAALTNAEPLGARAVQDLLDADTVLLAYSLGEERSFVWAIERDAVSARALPGRSRIESAARKLYESWVQRPGPSGLPPTDSAAASSADVSAMLLAPVADRIAGKRLVIVPDGALAFLPFAAIPMPGASARLLSADHEIVVLPSASTLAFLRSGPPRAEPSKTLAVVADPVFDRDDPRVRNRVAVARGPERAKDESRSRASVERSVRDTGASVGEGFRLERLSFTRREATAILALVPAGSRRASLDFEADREGALRDLSSYRFVHFATHAFSNALHPELSGLVLSLVDREGRDREGFIPASEVFNLSLSADLVVLSACRTALGKEVRGEGLVGLTRAFMYAGAPRVVASLWRVDDAATAELMKSFYEGMLGPGQLRPAAALKEAQARVRAQSRWSDPYYWAGFVLQGDWR